MIPRLNLPEAHRLGLCCICRKPAGPVMDLDGVLMTNHELIRTRTHCEIRRARCVNRWNLDHHAHELCLVKEVAS